MASDYKAQARAAKERKVNAMGVGKATNQASGDASSWKPPAPINTDKKAGKQPDDARSMAVDGRKRAEMRLGVPGRRPAYASGGRVGKGKTNINIIIAPQGAPSGQPPGGMPVPPPLPPGAVAGPAAPPPGPAGGPPGGAVPPALAAALAGGGGGPPMPPGQKRGGRIGYASGGKVKQPTNPPAPASDDWRSIKANPTGGYDVDRGSTVETRKDISDPDSWTKIRSKDAPMKRGGKVMGGLSKKAAGGAVSEEARETNMSRRFKPSPAGAAGAKSGVGRLNQAKHYAAQRKGGA